MPFPSRFAEWCLHRLLPAADADALIGDLREQAAGDDDDGAHAPSGVRNEWRVWQYILFALLPLATRRGSQLLRQVFRDAWRALRSAPAATAGIIGILTLGISAATVTFSVVDTVVLRPLPFDGDEDLVVVELRSVADQARVTEALGPTHYLRLRDAAQAIDQLAAVVQTSRLSMSVSGERIPLETVQVTARLFDTLRVPPLLGRVFTEASELEGSHHVGVISYDLWQRQFAGDPAVVGRTVAVITTAALGGATAEVPLTITGVMPRGFAYPMSMVPAPEIWTPYVMSPEERSGVARGQYLHVVGRLRPQASRDRAEAEIRSIAASWSDVEADLMRTRQFHVVSLKDTLVGDVRGWMLLVLGAVTVVMLIACVNVANLQLVRATRRIRELSIRASLGATRRQLVASLLVESLMLSVAAAVLAILVAMWGIGMARAGLPEDLARATAIGIDGRVLAATILAAVVTGVLFGLVPAWRASREDLVSLTKQGTLTMGTARRRWRTTFVIAEVAFVSVLLVGATLIITSFVRVTTADLGFDRSDLLFVSGQTGVQAADTTATIERLEQLSGVTAVGAIALGSPPLAMDGFRGGGATGMRIGAANAVAGIEPIVADTRSVSAGYFAAAGIPIVSGRTFGDEGPAPQQAIVIDEEIALALFGERLVVGREVAVGNGAERRIVTAVVRHVSLGGPEVTVRPQIYLPIRLDRGGFNYLVRIAAPLAEVVPAIRGALPAAVTSGPGAMQIRPLEDAFRNITADRRFNASLMSIFGLIAIVIGAAGIYGVMASVVAQQRREMGLRVALGATTGRIVSGVLGQAVRYLAIGMAIGLAAAWWASRALESILFDVQPGDPIVYGIVFAVMAVVGVAAAVIPARRAARVDPKVVLQSE